MAVFMKLKCFNSISLISSAPTCTFFERTVRFKALLREVNVPFKLVFLAIFTDGIKNRLRVSVSFSVSCTVKSWSTSWFSLYSRYFSRLSSHIGKCTKELPYSLRAINKLAKFICPAISKLKKSQINLMRRCIRLSLMIEALKLSMKYVPRLSRYNVLSRLSEPSKSSRLKPVMFA